MRPKLLGARVHIAFRVGVVVPRGHSPACIIMYRESSLYAKLTFMLTLWTMAPRTVDYGSKDDSDSY